MNRNSHKSVPALLACSQTIPFILAVIFLMGINSSSYATPIAVSSSLDLVATSGLAAFEVVDSVNASQGASTNSLGPISANAVSTSAGGTSITSGSASATWVNAAQGQVRFDDIGWDNSGFTNTIISLSSLEGTQWTYTFITDVTGLFSLDWNVVLQQPITDSGGLLGFRFSIAGTAGSQTVMGVNTSGSTTRNLQASTQYTALIQSTAGLFGGVGLSTSFMDAVFNWSMDSGPPSSVPEPTSLVLLGIGIAGLCVNRRRRLS